MKVLIFGGVGFIGTNVAISSLDKGYDVVSIDNLIRMGVEENLRYLKKYKKFKFIKGDIRKTSDFSKFPKNVDVILNFAANPSIPKSISDPLFDFEINAKGHLNVLEFARKDGRIPVILASSNKVYTDKTNTLRLIEKKNRYVLSGAKYKNGFDENIDVDGNEGFTNSPYGASKLVAEKYSREYWKNYGLPIVINRMSNVYGLFQKGTEMQGWVDWFLRAKKYGLPIRIYGTGKQVRDALFGTDLASLYMDQIEKFDTYNGKTFNVGGGSEIGFNISLLELIDLIDNNFPGNKLTCKFASWRPSDLKIYISNLNRIKSVSGWMPTTKILDGLKKMWSSYK